LQVTNAADLLGPLPPPQHFVEALLGGQTAYTTVAKPDKVEAWLLSTNAAPESKTNRTAAVELTGKAAKRFSKALTDFDTYNWLLVKDCAPDYGVRLRFTRRDDTVEFLLCCECDTLQITRHGTSVQRDFDAAHDALVQAVQAVFPQDATIKNLKLHADQPAR
jgi:hypothetical protein